MKKTVYFLLICFVGILHSCQEDEISTDSSIQSKKEISFTELQRRLNISTKFSVSNETGKGIEEFVIDTTINIVQIQTNAVTTYSMKVIPIGGEDGNLYNLYIYDEKGKIIQEIVKYELKEGDSISEENTEIIYTERIGCLILVIAPCEYGNWHDDDHCEGDGWVTIRIGCDGAGSGGGSGSSGGGDGDTGGNGPVTPIGHEPIDGGSGGGSGGNGNQLENDLNNWFGEGNWGIIPNPPNDLPSFNSLSDAFNYVYGDALDGNEGFLTGNLVIGDSRITRYRLKFWNTAIGGERGLNLYMKQLIDSSQRPNITNVTTTWYGGNNFNTWTQVDYASEDTNICSDCKKITIYGELRTGFFIQNVGVFVDNKYQIEVILKKDGTVFRPPCWWNIY